MKIDNCKYSNSYLKSNGLLIKRILLNSSTLLKIKNLITNTGDLLESARFWCGVFALCSDGRYYAVGCALVSNRGVITMVTNTDEIYLGEDFEITQWDSFICYCDYIEPCK